MRTFLLSAALRYRELLVDKAVRLLQALGATKIHRINKAPFVIHSHSTMRMGLSEADPVLDEKCRSQVGEAVIYCRQLCVGKRDWRPQPHADDTSISQSNGRDQISALLQWRSLGPRRNTRVVN